MTLTNLILDLLEVVDGIWRELKLFFQGAFVWSCLQRYSMKPTISPYNYKDFKLFKTDEPKPELVKTVILKELSVSKIKGK
jgi:hypothetical protein